MVLIQLERVQSVLVDKRKMGCADNLFCRYASVVRYGIGADHFPDKGVFENCQIFTNSGKELQHIELRLIRKTNRPDGFNRKRNTFGKICLEPDCIKCLHFVLKLLFVVNGINKAVFDFEIAVDFPTHDFIPS